jgi:hypothetical protein
MGVEQGTTYVPSGRGPIQGSARVDFGEGKAPNPLFDTPYDVGNKYLQWALHQENRVSRFDVFSMPNCFHCGGNSPCTAKVCVNCRKPH